ncbi:MAG: metallophosphoesterase [Candidatus Woesearchaeota archaeon]
MNIAKEKLLEYILYFSSVFLYMWMNYVIILKIGSFIGLDFEVRIFIVLLILSFSYLISVRLERQISNKFTRMLYVFAVYWMGLIFISFVTLMLYDTISRFYQIPFIITMGIMLILFFWIIPIALKNGKKLTIKELEFTHKNITKPVTIVQLSDLHLGSIHTHKFLPRVFEKIKDLEYDVICITGDLADGSAPITHETVEAFEHIQKPVFFVSGNHDYLNGKDRFFKALEQTPITVLESKKRKVKGITFCGTAFSKVRNYAYTELEKLKLPKDSYVVHLNHIPLNIKKLSEFPVNLMICGHTHHGQIKPAHIFAKLVYKTYKGLHAHNQTFMYISPGTGNWGPPMRIGTRNEITIIRLKPEQEN